jgi:hypothetical protein
VVVAEKPSSGDASVGVSAAVEVGEGDEKASSPEPRISSAVALSTQSRSTPAVSFIGKA